MENSILQNFQTQEKVYTLRLTQAEYSRVVSQKLIKIDGQTASKCGAKFKLICGDMFGFYYLYAVIDEYGFFTNKL